MPPKMLKSEEIEATVQRVVKETFLAMMQESGALQTLANLIKDAVVSELQRSIDFNSEVIQDLKQTIEQRDRKIGELERKVDDLEQYQRRRSRTISEKTMCQDLRDRGGGWREYRQARGGTGNEHRSGTEGRRYRQKPPGRPHD
ncbi:hypothetical protein ANN_10858 [Periplaneta americana]|uniref:Uncharacterized protein n=1 Tax=Periplaneta americana TaxID=6978 RepID=A0ABQ8T3F3_PERAM|nr:hypothetical protein ANN_10858 [Periplaneta americana]